MKKNYLKPKIITKKIKLNLFFRKTRVNPNEMEGLLMAAYYTCQGTRTGSC